MKKTKKNYEEYLNEMIQENNTMIAVFMGDIEYSKKHRGWYCAETMELDSFPLFFKGKGNYNESWDCLMSVVVRIAREERCNILGAFNRLRTHTKLSTKREVYQAVVEYINQFEL